MPRYASRATGLHRLHCRLLVRGQHLEQFGMNSGLLHRQFHHRRRLLRGESTNLGVIVGALLILFQLLPRLLQLLEQWLQSGIFFGQNAFHLRRLSVAQVQVVGKKLAAAAAPAKLMPMRGRGG